MVFFFIRVIYKIENVMTYCVTETKSIRSQSGCQNIWGLKGENDCQMELTAGCCSVNNYIDHTLGGSTTKWPLGLLLFEMKGHVLKPNKQLSTKKEENNLHKPDWIYMTFNI